jgi:hypothetical protein
MNEMYGIVGVAEGLLKSESGFASSRAIILSFGAYVIGTLITAFLTSDSSVLVIRMLLKSVPNKDVYFLNNEK